jgi:hypothetical protein
VDVVRYVEKIRGGSVEYLDELLRSASRFGDEDLVEAFGHSLFPSLRALGLVPVVDVCLPYLGELGEERSRLLAFRLLYEACRATKNLEEAYRVAVAALGQEKAREGFYRSWCQDHGIAIGNLGYQHEVDTRGQRMLFEAALETLDSETPIESPVDLIRKVAERGKGTSSGWRQEFLRALRSYRWIWFRPVRLVPGAWKIPKLLPTGLSPFLFPGARDDRLSMREKQKILRQFLETDGGRQRLASSMTMPLRRRMDYAAVARQTFPVEQLPDPVVPVYDVGPDEDQ